MRCGCYGTGCDRRIKITISTAGGHVTCVGVRVVEIVSCEGVLEPKTFAERWWGFKMIHATPVSNLFSWTAADRGRRTGKGGGCGR